METQKIKTYRRGTVVKLNEEFILTNRFSNKSVTLPAGTKLAVWRGKRNGLLNTSIVDDEVQQLARDHGIYTNDVDITSDKVSEAEKPKAKVEVGDIFVCSWGYEQTNIDFYKVTGIKGKTAAIQAMTSNKNYTGHMHGECMPGAATGEIIKKRILTDAKGNVAFKIYDFARATKWDGKPEHFSEWH